MGDLVDDDYCDGIDHNNDNDDDHQENLDWSMLAERATWLASKSETTVASLLSMAGQVITIIMIIIILIKLIIIVIMVMVFFYFII